MWGERWILGLAIHDQLPEIGWETPTVTVLRWMEFGKETAHAIGVEAIGLAIDRPGSRAGLHGTLGWGLTKQDDRPNQFIEDLLRPVEEKLELLPIICWLKTPALGSRHSVPQERGGVVRLLRLPPIEQLYVAPPLARSAHRTMRHGPAVQRLGMRCTAGAVSGRARPRRRSSGQPPSGCRA